MSQQSREPHDRVSADHDNASQIDRFKDMARELGCDEDEAAFDAALKKLAEVKGLPKHEPKKRSHKND